MGELVDKNAMLNRLKRVYEENKEYSVANGLAMAYEMVQGQPTAEAESKWIPVNERLPKDNRWKQIIVTLDPSYGDGKHMVSRCAYFTHGRFYSCESHGVYMNSAVKAWMPLPKPYERKEE